MKIAITGHTAGIGKALADNLTNRGHDIIGISKRDGNNIRNIPKTVDKIQYCDMWINNAQSGYAQTELLFKIWELWKDNPDKIIWNISTLLTSAPGIPLWPGMTEVAIAEYKNQKRSLEDAFYQMREQSQYPHMCMIRPGSVSTHPGQIGANVNHWVDALINFYISASDQGLWFDDISLDMSKGAPNL
jgi:hypothetical protein